MSDSIIYEDIFEAIHELDPQNQVYNCKDKGGYMVRRQNYTLIDMEDGTIGAMTLSPNPVYYRGENDKYQSCKPNLYRIENRNKRLIWQIKTCDFIHFLKEISEIQSWVRSGQYLEFTALAQHYEFPTSMLDVTNDILVAAFFATHFYNRKKQKFEVKAEGVGCLRWYIGFPKPMGRITPIGLQPFARPGRQSAYGIYMSEEEDFADMSGKIYFKQDYRCNLALSRAIMEAAMFLPEEPIMQLVGIIKDNPIVTGAGVEQYCSESGAKREEVEEILKQEGVYVTDAPLLVPQMLEGPIQLPVHMERKAVIRAPFQYVYMETMEEAENKGC